MERNLSVRVRNMFKREDEESLAYNEAITPILEDLQQKAVEVQAIKDFHDIIIAGWKERIPAAHEVMMRNPDKGNSQWGNIETLLKIAEAELHLNMQKSHEASDILDVLNARIQDIKLYLLHEQIKSKNAFSTQVEEPLDFRAIETVVLQASAFLELVQEAKVEGTPDV